MKLTPNELFRPGAPFFLIAGPCVLEDDGLNLEVAGALVRLADELALPVVYKASFDKANRAGGDSARGPGLEDGLRRLERVQRESGLPVLTDVHEPWQAAPAADVCDALQIPAFLSRQTDLIRAAAATGRPLNLKKGQWMAPEEMAGAVAKARAAGAQACAVTERGTFFGYGDLVVDMRSFERLRHATAAPAVFDGTHSVQRPGRAGSASGGDPRFTRPLVCAAVAAGADALFLEVHPEPTRAPSDGANMLPLQQLRPLLLDVLAIREALRAGEAVSAGRATPAPARA
ncbi:MAG: 3-deoxy-8-phosphooctulonate synthase [Gemmatimonadetes bacterium]|nr:3-deoxy-8-phosphooctulonate synthase [Gemmatimonadota bacterium]